PALFKRMKVVQERMAEWMQMPMIPLRAQMATIESIMEPLKERVFQVGLYAGLTEQAEQIAEGAPAAYHDKLHVFQLRRYMDEECLLDYDAGGIDIQGIQAFDAWLAKPETGTAFCLSHGVWWPCVSDARSRNVIGKAACVSWASISSWRS
ncbi:hypothetical protein GGI1_13354, partial [Acidithiobacillus sp. GGI-221]